MTHAELVNKIREAGVEGDWAKMKATVNLLLDLYKNQEMHIKNLMSLIEQHEKVLDRAIETFSALHDKTFYNS
tara:strand:+ start:592 stop:810 length:219 start_codon:yes stop_codon:yes gene_type:complete